MEASACWVFGRCGPLHFRLEKCRSDQAGSVFAELDAALHALTRLRIGLDPRGIGPSIAPTLLD